MKYLAKLTELGITENDLSERLKKMIATIVKLQGMLAETGRSDQEKQDITKDLADLDTDTANAIAKWYPQRGKYAEMTKRLENNRAGKKGTQSAAAGAAVNADGTVTPPAEPAAAVTPPVEPTATVTPPEEPPAAVTPPEEKKSGGAWGWVIGIAAAVAFVAFGMPMINKK